MEDSITWYIHKIFTVYFLIISLICGAICYFHLQKLLKPHYPTESKIAKYGGLTYMIGGPLLFILGRLLH